MLLEKYAPTKSSELSNGAAVIDIKKFLATWRRGKALLIYGPPGSGKSAAVKLVAEEAGYSPVEVETPKAISSKESGVFSKKKLFIVEAAPMGSLVKLIDSSAHPVVCITDDAYAMASSVRRKFRLVKFDKIGDAEITRFLEDICRKEKIDVPKRELEQLARMSNGDIRAALIDLEVRQRLGYRDTEDSIFNTIKIIFKTLSMENSRIAVRNSGKDPEEILLWLEQNVAEEYSGVALAAAYNYISKADIFQSRIIRRQSWGLQKYLADLPVFGVSLAKDRASLKYTAYRPPVFVRHAAPALEKIAKHTHVSKRRAVNYIPLVRILAKKGIAEQLGMDEKEIAMIM